jgi:conjugal transfer ATP-binding protein TraC
MTARSTRVAGAFRRYLAIVTLMLGALTVSAPAGAGQCVGRFANPITDAGMNKATQAAFDNSAWKFHLKQSDDTLKKIEKGDVMDLSPGLKRMLKSLRPVPGRYSEFVLVDPNGGTHLLRHIPDEFTLAMATTKGPDYEFMEQLRTTGTSTEDAIRALIQAKRK